LSCVLLRKCLTKAEDSLYSKLSPQARQHVKRELLSALQQEQVGEIRRKLVYCVSGLASGLIEGGDYPELIPTLFNWCKPETPPALRESALGVFTQLATFLLEKGLEPYLRDLKNVFSASLKDSNSKIRLAALEATSSVILVINKKQRQGFVDLIPLMLQVSCFNLFLIIIGTCKST